MHFGILKKQTSILFAGAAFLVSCGGSGCWAKQTDVQKQTSFRSKQQLARDLIQQDWDLFADFNRARFSESVHKDFQPDRNAFVNEVDAAFASVVPLSLTFNIDQVLPSDDKQAVSITWQRKAVDRDTGQLTLDEGECTIVYIREGTDWYLYQIRGNSIFTF
jgi:hypothetical protein